MGFLLSLQALALYRLKQFFHVRPWIQAPVPPKNQKKLSLFPFIVYIAFCPISWSNVAVPCKEKHASGQNPLSLSFWLHAVPINVIHSIPLSTTT
jgi:hypothetical protein